MVCAVVVAASLAGGCHLIFPFDRTSAQAPDDGGLDANTPREAGGDSEPIDARPDARPTTDGDAGGACSENQALPSSARTCPGPCTGPLDCDGLPNYRDPYPGECNELLYEETFGQDTTSSWSLATAVQPLPWKWSCGKLTQSRPDGLSWALASASLSTADYLVEARLTLGTIGALATSNKLWQAGIYGRYVDSSSPDFLACDLWINEKGTNAYFSIPWPDVHILSKAPGKTAVAAYPPLPIKTYDGAAGKSYYLQLWHTRDITKLVTSLGLTVATPCLTPPNCPAVICRVCDDNVCWRTGWYGAYTESNPNAWIPQKTGTVGLMTNGRSASFDFIRVFELLTP